jgi:hypothetical protein
VNCGRGLSPITWVIPLGADFAIVRRHSQSPSNGRLTLKIVRGLSIKRMELMRGLMQPTFDIFRGTTKADGIWLESVGGLSNSKDRMHQIAAENPGCYFVFASHDQSIRARTETTGKGGDAIGRAYSRRFE